MFSGRFVFLQMRYRVVLIFPDAKSLSGFIQYMQTSGEVDGRECAFVGTLDEDQIDIARLLFDAYIQVIRLVQ